MISISIIVVAGFVVGIGFIVLYRWHQAKRIQVLRATPPPQHWHDILRKRFPTVYQLTEPQQAKLFGLMQVFLDRIRFEGCGGQDITETVKVVIAAQACLLLVGQEQPIYPRLKTVLVYPHTYNAGAAGRLGGKSIRLGESWTFGVVVLSWDSVIGGARNVDDGHNVTLHEFAHQLDQEDGVGDGAPILEARSAYVTWGRVFSADFERLCKRSAKGKRDVIDRYGATNPAEFFAVATETFFEKPRQLNAKHPELYDQLQSYYNVNPLNWE
jgi:Mlc titration factor MtfA (ptsG expression regulator)